MENAIPCFMLAVGANAWCHSDGRVLSVTQMQAADDALPTMNPAIITNDLGASSGRSSTSAHPASQTGMNANIPKICGVIRLMA